VTDDWSRATRRGAYLVYRDVHLRTLVVPDRGYTVAVRLTDDVTLDRFRPPDIAATSGDLPGPAWVALHPESVERTYVASATAWWDGDAEFWAAGGRKVWLAGAPDLGARTVLVGSTDPFEEDLLRGRPSVGSAVVGWFTRARLDELIGLEVTEEPYQLP